MRLAVTVLAILSSIMLPGRLQAAQTEVAAAPPGVKTDRGLYPPPRAPVLPKAGGAFTDPTFGTEIMRVTDEDDGKENCNAYSYWPSFNTDSTRFHIACGNRHMLYSFDPKAFRLISKQPLFAEKPPSGHEPRWEDAMWADADPNLLYCHEGLNLWAYNVVTGKYTLVKDFSKVFPPGHLCQLSKNSDDDIFAGSLQDPKWNRTGYFVWRRNTDEIVLRKTADHDEVQVDKSGRYCVVKTGRQGKGVVEVRVVDLRTGKIEDLTDDGPDFAPGHSDNGRGLVVGHDNVRNRVTFRRLDSPHDVRTLLDLKNDWSQDYHVSMLAADESWATLSFYVGNKLPSSGVFKNEIVLVATDGSRRVRRLAHHRSVFKSYWDSPRANISRDGRFMVFTSNWEGTGQRDVFILKVPPMQEFGQGRPMTCGRLFFCAESVKIGWGLSGSARNAHLRSLGGNFWAEASRIREKYACLLETMVNVRINSSVQAFRTAKCGRQCSKKLLCGDGFGNIGAVDLVGRSGINGKW